MGGSGGVSDGISRRLSFSRSSSSSSSRSRSISSSRSSSSVLSCSCTSCHSYSFLCFVIAVGSEVVFGFVVYIVMADCVR